MNLHNKHITKLMNINLTIFLHSFFFVFNNFHHCFMFLLLEMDLYRPSLLGLLFSIFGSL